MGLKHPKLGLFILLNFLGSAGCIKDIVYIFDNVHLTEHTYNACPFGSKAVSEYLLHSVHKGSH